jgi:DNA processing protein
MLGKMEVNCLSKQSLWLLTAMQFRGIGPVAVRKLYQELATADHDQRDKMISVQRTRFIATTVAEKEALDKVDCILMACYTHDIGITSLLEDSYPRRLRSIKDAPPILYYKGSVDALQKSGCAVVGTRKASEVGTKIAHKIAVHLSVKGYSVVSGLALGIDSAAHRGALSAWGTTVAVMAHGLDTIHPRSNNLLAQEILESGGALLSEHQPGVPPRPAEFVRRNRIQSGMSICSIIVESGTKGGAIHQANFTVDQGRPLYVVSPDMNNPQTHGFNMQGATSLIENNGAVPLNNSEELIEILAYEHGLSAVADNGYFQAPLF